MFWGPPHADRIERLGENVTLLKHGLESRWGLDDPCSCRSQSGGYIFDADKGSGQYARAVRGGL